MRYSSHVLLVFACIEQVSIICHIIFDKVLVFPTSAVCMCEYWEYVYAYKCFLLTIMIPLTVGIPCMSILSGLFIGYVCVGYVNCKILVSELTGIRIKLRYEILREIHSNVSVIFFTLVK